ncbi:MAG: DUF1772 domain-containing protein [Hyphomicrobium sp.]
MFGQFAIAVAALFSGAAVYISIAEQPARLGLPDQPLLAEWKPSYARGFMMQASLAIMGFALGALEWIVTGNWMWGLGAALLIANWPYTLLVMMPINKQLDDTPINAAGPQTRALIQSWGRKHAVRTLLGFASLGAFLWAAL